MTVEEFFREKEEFHQSEEFLWQCRVCVCVCVCVCVNVLGQNRQ